MVFMGGIAGPVRRVGSTLTCGSQGTGFSVDMKLFVPGATDYLLYRVHVATNQFHGAGDYTIGGSDATIELTITSESGGVWHGTSGKVTLNSDQKSGTLDASTDGANTVVVHGTWSC
jgi:hypothetical protein